MASAASRRALARIIAERLVSGRDGATVMREVAVYLVSHQMIDEADALINDIAEEIFRQTGKLVVEVTSARTLSDEARTNLIKYLQDETSAREVELHETVDESLIGGLVAKTPSAELDISVKNKLRQLTALA